MSHSNLQRAASRISDAVLSFARAVEQEQVKVRAYILRDLKSMVEQRLRERNQTLTATQVAELARVRRGVVLAALKSGALTGEKVGTDKRSRWIIRLVDAEAWIETLQR